MTIENAKKVIRRFECNSEHYEACEMAIVSLEAWEKVKQDIQTETDDKSNNMYFNLGMLGALAIINKHLQEVEHEAGD